MRKMLNILVPITICFLVGFMASYIQAGPMRNWYPSLIKPNFIPPDIVFSIVWSVLYICMGTSVGLIINSKTEKISPFILLFAAQLFLNFFWSVTFFYFQSPLLGLINILLLDIISVIYTVKTYPGYKVSSILFFPYLLWLLFATYLNIYIFIFN